MPFENVRIRTEEGSEFGPVTWAQLLQWHGEGRVPLTATLIDIETGEEKPASEFAALTQRPVTPAEEATPTVPPTPVPVGGGAYAQPYQQGFAPTNASFGTAFEAGWSAFRQYMGVSILTTLVYMLITIVGAVIPLLNIGFVVFVLPVLMGGMATFFLKVVRAQDPQIGDLFSGFSRYWSWIGTTVLLWLISLACSLPQIAVIIYFYTKYGPLAGNIAMQSSPIYWVSAALSLIIALIVITRFSFAYFRIADGQYTFDALKTSTVMVQGRTLLTIALVIVLYLLTMLGALALVIGLLFTLPLAGTIFAAYYCGVQQQTQTP